MRMRGLMTVALAVAFGATGCMEVEQNSGVAQKQGKYQGKPDGKSWENEPLAVGGGNGKWTKGDKVTWETQIKARNNSQNEYKRIGD